VQEAASSPEVSSSPPGPGPHFPPGKSDSFDERQKLGLAAVGSVSSSGSGPGSGLSLGEGSNFISTAAAEIQPETLEKFWDSKAVRDKRIELDKKLEALRKKHDKDRKASKPPKKSHVKLVKRISSKNL